MTTSRKKAGRGSESHSARGFNTGTGSLRSTVLSCFSGCPSAFLHVPDVDMAVRWSWRESAAVLLGHRVTV
ncbi:hypothetical protein AMELA_G00009200 [Ameiurus melas]|uniref:Uncharacterized protein n=1 Tax=Ameiurus melas TaxID=219545 RepID=A0A7J6BG57_AMEME|nr:hypothetical protein AMELA_G00009200 [Ameiurus melas]